MTSEYNGISVFGPHVLVQPKKLEEVSKGGIVIPQMHREDYQRAITEGKVVAIGPTAFLDELNPSKVIWYKVGDRVLYGKFAGKEIKYNDELYIILKYEDILIGLGEEVDSVADPVKD